MTNKSPETNIPRNPNKEEYQQLVDYLVGEMDDIQAHNGHCSYDAGDLGFMLDNASIAVFDYFNPKPAPMQYSGKLMSVVWGLRYVDCFVWQDGQFHRVSDDNLRTIR